MATEIEMKFEIDPQHAAKLATLPMLSRCPVETLQLHNTYFDTRDLQLKQQRIALRTRFDGRHWWQTLKSAGESVDGLHMRDEWECQVDSADLDLGKLEQAGASSRTLDWLNGLSLLPVFTTRFQRTLWLFEDPGRSIEIVLDRGEVNAGDRQENICEIELELKKGDLAALQQLARLLGGTLPLHPSNISKAARGYELLRA